MSPIIVTLLAFAAGFSAIFAVNLILTDLFRRDLQDIQARMQFEKFERDRDRVRRDLEERQQGNLGQLAQEAMREAQESKGFAERVEEILQQSGVRISRKKLWLYTAGAALCCGGVLFAVTGGPLEGLLGGVLGGCLPMIYVLYKRKKRMEALRGQLADALELMSRTLRAGQTITQAMQVVSTEYKPPVATEFGYCFEQQRLGLGAELALRELARRTGVLEVKIFVLAVLVHRQAGGNLTELLDKLAEIIRERFKLRGKIKAMTAEGRMQALILLAMPPAMFLIMLLLNREYTMGHFEHPSLLMATAASMSLGALWIRKIVNFAY
jgi:tight adherence protein B